MEQAAPGPITVINPQPAPNDSFVGPEFLEARTKIKRSDKKCTCTACGVEKDCTVDKLYSHPVLNVLVCSSCHRFYHMGDFTKDSQGYDEHCRWCGQGGKLLMCDSKTCTYSFCNYCIQRNFSDEVFREILAKETWLCFACDKEQLERHVEECQKFVNFVNIGSECKLLEANQLNVPASLTETNEQIDSIIGPLERSCNGLDGAINSSSKTDVDTMVLDGKKVSPLTILRNKERYIIQQRSVSCDESDRVSNNPKTQSDSELRSGKKLARTTRSQTQTEKLKFLTSLNNIHQPTSSTIAENNPRERDPGSSIEMEEDDDNCNANNKVEALTNVSVVGDKGLQEVDEGTTTKKAFPTRKNLGRRTKPIPSAPADQHKIIGSQLKLQKAGDLFDEFITIIHEIISEECVSNHNTTNGWVQQSPSQYSRFRATKAVLSRVRKASKQLSTVTDFLTAAESQLGTYRVAPRSERSALGKSGDTDLEGDHKKGKNLSKIFPSNSDSNAKDLTESSDISDTSFAEDVKLKVDPKVVLLKLRDDEIEKWFQGYDSVQSDTSSSSLSLDTDCSKRHIEDNSESSDDKMMLNETSGQTRKHANIKKVSKRSKGRSKKYLTSDEDFDSTLSNTGDSSATSISADPDTDDEMIAQQEINNDIAKKILLQRLQNNHVDGVDSDVENMLTESFPMKDIKKEFDSANESTVKKMPNESKPTFVHPLLSKQWNGSSPSANAKAQLPKSKRKLSSENGTSAVKKKKHCSLDRKNVDDSDSNLSTDSNSSDVRVTRSRWGDKRKRRVINSESSDEMKGESNKDSSSSASDFESKLLNKRRRSVRSKPITTSPDVDESPKKQGRRNIRKVLDDSKVSQSTQEAKIEEIERRKRVEAKEQSEEDNIADVIVVEDEGNEDNMEQVTVIPRLLLSKKPLVEVHPEIVKMLKAHQREGIRFIWNNLIEKVEHADSKPGTGCILSHCMGLGKTIQTIAFLHTVLLDERLSNLKTALILCPYITVNNWKAEFDKWVPRRNKCSGKALLFYNLDSTKIEQDRIARLLSWQKNGGVLVMGYSLFRSLLKEKKNAPTTDSVWHKTLLGPDILVCDEGHVLKNAASAIAQFVGNVKTKRKLILTGTPLQNNMIEYHCMVSLVKPKLLGDLKEFKNRFVNPIENGQHVDSTQRDVRLMKKRAHVLHELLAGCVQRKDYTFLKEHLLPKYEYTLKVRLSQLQIRLYKKYLSLKETGNLKSRKACLFRDFNKLLLVVCHPRCLVMQKEMNKKKETECDNDEDEDDEDDDGSSSDGSVVVISDDDGGIPSSPVIPKPMSLDDIHALSSGKLRLFIKSKSGKHPDIKCRKKLVSLAIKYLDENFCKTREFEESLKHKPVSELKALIAEHGGSLIGCSEKKDLVNLVKSLVMKEAVADEEWFEKLMPSQEKLYFANEHGGKIVLMLEILRGAAKLRDKVVIFSQSLTILDLIELVLRAESKEAAASKSGDIFPKWVRDKDYFRIDGCIHQNKRSSIIASFNDPKNSRGRLLLVSTRAGSMGVNLVGANRAIVFDASWNPSHDIQSIFRIYRFGQNKTCYIYRLVAQGTMEEKIYERQVVKRSLSYRVVDEQQIPRHFTAADISELYTFKPDQLQQRKDSMPECAPPRDALLASILNSTNLVVSFHEPDTLLDHQVSEELSEAERKAAWEEYEKYKPTDNPASASFKSYVMTLPQTLLQSLHTNGNNLLRLIDTKLLEVSGKPLDEIVMHMRIEDRFVSTDQANLKAIQQKLDQHVQVRRLNNIKKIVLRHRDVVQNVLQSHSTSGTFNPQRSIPSSSGSAMFTNQPAPGSRHYAPVNAQQRQKQQTANTWKAYGRNAFTVPNTRPRSATTIPNSFRFPTQHYQRPPGPNPR